MIEISEVFCSLQGEGWLQGLPAVFIRLAGCNLRCSFCDTKYAWEKGRMVTEEELVKAAERYNTGCAILTGGEPCAQDITKLVALLKKRKFFVAVETNGTIWRNTGCDWITVSPKREGFRLYRNGYHANFRKVAREFKYVITKESDFSLVDRHIPVPIILQPVNNDPAVARMIAGKIQAERMPWFLRMQLHKILKIP